MKMKRTLQVIAFCLICSGVNAQSHEEGVYSRITEQFGLDLASSSSFDQRIGILYRGDNKKGFGDFRHVLAWKTESKWHFLKSSASGKPFDVAESQNREEMVRSFETLDPSSITVSDTLSVNDPSSFDILLERSQFAMLPDESELEGFLWIVENGDTAVVECGHCPTLIFVVETEDGKRSFTYHDWSHTEHQPVWQVESAMSVADFFGLRGHDNSTTTH